MKAPRIPAHIADKACQLLADYLAGRIHARRGRGVRYLSLNVGRDYRLLCLDSTRHKEPDAWQVLSHERYSKYVTGTRH